MLPGKGVGAPFEDSLPELRERGRGDSSGRKFGRAVTMFTLQIRRWPSLFALWLVLTCGLGADVCLVLNSLSQQGHCTCPEVLWLSGRAFRSHRKGRWFEPS